MSSMICVGFNKCIKIIYTVVFQRLNYHDSTIIYAYIQEFKNTSYDGPGYEWEP